MPKSWKLHRGRHDDASDNRSASTSAGNAGPPSSKKQEKAKLDPKDFPGRFPDGDLSVDLGPVNEALGLTANGEGIPRIDAHPGAFPPSMVQLIRANEFTKAHTSTSTAGPSNARPGPFGAPAGLAKNFAGPPNTTASRANTSTGPTNPPARVSSTNLAPATSTTAGPSTTGPSDPSVGPSRPGFTGMSQSSQPSAPAGASGANAAAGNGGVAAGALNGLAGVPMNAGQQMDVNFLYKRVVELSEVLKENRERTQGIINGAEELAVSDDADS